MHARTFAHRLARIAATAVAAGLLAVVLVAMLAPAGAQDDDGGQDTNGADDTRAEHREELRACLEEHGVELPDRPGEGRDRESLSDEERTELRAALDECGPIFGHRAPWLRHRARDALRDCFEEQGVDVPSRGDDGRLELTDEQRAALDDCREQWSERRADIRECIDEQTDSTEPTEPTEPTAEAESLRFT
jgi:hypothetical protein